MQLDSIISSIEASRQGMIDDMVEMIRIPAIGPFNGGKGEGERADQVMKYLAGFDSVERVDVPDDCDPTVMRPNILARKNGRGKGTVWIVSHLDTVLPGDLSQWDSPPFEPRVDGDRIYGLGTEDNGQAVIASIYGARFFESGSLSKMSIGLAFVADDEGEIVWSGEAAYLGEALQKCLDGTLDRGAQRKLSPLLDELPTLLRGDNESRMRRLVDSIFRIEPGQPTALRIRLFVLESNGRAAEALKLVQSQIKLAPKVTRLYFEAMNLIARNPQLASENEAVVRAYTAAVTNDPDADNQMAWMLLTRQPDDPEALKSAKLLTERAKSQLQNDAQGALRGSCLNTQALLACRLGKLEEAQKLQTEAIRLFREADLPGAVADAQRRLRYFETVLSLAR